jgi:hypothetical protein
MEIDVWMMEIDVLCVMEIGKRGEARGGERERGQYFVMADVGEGAK